MGPMYVAYMPRGHGQKNGNFDVFLMTINGPKATPAAAPELRVWGGGLSDFWRFESHRRHLRAYKLMSDTLTNVRRKRET